MPTPVPEPPLLTPDLPGCGGRIRERDDDFEVEEVPSYEPTGTGDHLYLWVEKRGMAPEFFARTVAQRLGVRPGDVGPASGCRCRRRARRGYRTSTATACAC